MARLRPTPPALGFQRHLHPEPGRILTDIRDAAVHYVEQGWSVQPGTYQVDGSPCWHGSADAVGLQPIAPAWSAAGITDAAHAREVWTRRPYSILMACGPVVDALQVPAALGALVIHDLRAARCLPPIIAGPFDTWLLLIAPGEPMLLELVLQRGIRVHGRGQWIVLPSTAFGRRPYRWRMHPRAVNWSVPPARAVQRIVLDVVAPEFRRRRRADAQRLRRGSDDSR
ncbi:MAG: bifunctional DNA primase/polymerase [Sciscionella sp.]